MAEIVRFGDGSYGVRTNGKFASLRHSTHEWSNDPQYRQYYSGTLDEAKKVFLFYKKPVVVSLDEIEAVEPCVAKPTFTVIEPSPRHINIDRHDLYFFLAAQVVIILLAGVHFK